MTECEKIELVSLFSGSKGNSTFVRAGDVKILIDAGGTAKAILHGLEEIGHNMSEISAIFVTHEHSDHTHALPVLAKKYNTPIHMTKASAEALHVTEGTPISGCIVVHEGEFSVSFENGTTVEAFITPHDSVQCVGYKITYGRRSVGVATDLGYVTQRVYDMLYGCEAVMLESNHDREMVKNGSYAETLKRRILSNGGHLSNDDCAEIAAALARSGTHAFMLAHLSRDNNTPDVALETVKSSLCGYSASVIVADPEKVTILAHD